MDLCKFTLFVIALLILVGLQSSTVITDFYEERLEFKNPNCFVFLILQAKYVKVPHFLEFVKVRVGLMNTELYSGFL
jgi:hypothetical protein